MGKTFRASVGIEEKLLAAFSFGVPEIDPTRDFLTVGTPREDRIEVAVAPLSSADLK